MPSIKDQVTEAQVDSLHAVISHHGDKVFCFTRLVADAWVVGVSNGSDLWRLELDDDELEVRRDAAGIGTVDAFLTKFRHAFEGGDLEITGSGTKLVLYIGKASGITFELFEAKASEKRTDMTHLLFYLAEKTTVLQMKVHQLQQGLHNKETKMRDSGSTGVAFDSTSQRTPPKAKAVPANMSIINPASRKRKAAKGVEFE